VGAPVAHLQFTGWPDFGVPQTPAEIVDLVRVTDYFRTRLGWERPVVTHCSAGIGRAGTFIAIHQASHLIRCGQRPKIMDLVYTMRQCRAGMVQTDQQYLFIHRTVHEIEHSTDLHPLSASAAFELDLHPSPSGSPIPTQPLDSAGFAPHPVPELFSHQHLSTSSKRQKTTPMDGTLDLTSSQECNRAPQSSSEEESDDSV